MSLPTIRPRDARAAIAAAHRHGRVADALDEIDDLGTRARVSTLLPEVRLRVTRLVDENQSLSPTSYDANRTTASGGASLWLEARATWKLDRLVFASEEVRLAQLRQEAEKRIDRRTRDVLDLLFAWQRAVYAMHDALLETSRCVEAWLSEQQLAATLDLETGGWFSRWRARKRIREPDCVELFLAPVEPSEE